MNSYFEKYLKYKLKYLKIINQEAGSKSSYTVDIFSDILSLNSSNKREFLNKYVRIIETSRNIVNIDGFCPLLSYLFKGGRDKQLVEFLFPDNLDLFNIVDSDGDTIFHKLVKEGNINLLEEFYFRDTTLASKIILAKNKRGYTILALAAEISSGNAPLLNGLSAMYEIGKYEDNKTLWLYRKSSSVARTSSIVGDYSSTKNERVPRSTSFVPPVASVEVQEVKAEGKRKVHSDIHKNLEELRKLKSGTPIRRDKRNIVFFYHYMTKRMLSAYIHNEQIKKIDTLYLVKKMEIPDYQQINDEISRSWKVDHIRFVDNLDLPDLKQTFDFVVQLEYDMYEQESDEDSA
jgi:hypothetical protein